MIPKCRVHRNKMQARPFKGNVQVELGSYVCCSINPTTIESLTVLFTLKIELHPIYVRIPM